MELKVFCVCFFVNLFKSVDLCSDEVVRCLWVLFYVIIWLWGFCLGIFSLDCGSCLLFGNGFLILIYLILRECKYVWLLDGCLVEFMSLIKFEVYVV